MPLRSSKPAEKTVTTFVHDEASRRNIPTAEFEPLMRPEQQAPVRVAYARRNRDLDPQLIWRGKYPGDDPDAEQPLSVNAPPLYIQEKVHPKVLIDDLKRETERQRRMKGETNGFADLQPDLFADFNGLPSPDARTEFYQHEQHWSNRMILGDSLQVMASLAEREALRGKVQCIYFDPPYGIKFNSNFQWSTTSRDVKDGNTDHITREPEQVKAFRDTWRDGIHSYLSYIRDRLVVARDLLTESGSIFVQIGDENVHRVRAVMDEVFGEDSFCGQIGFEKTRSQTSELLSPVADFLLWYCSSREQVKFRRLLAEKIFGEAGTSQYKMVELRLGDTRRMAEGDLASPLRLPIGSRVFSPSPLVSESGSESTRKPLNLFGREFSLTKGSWKTSPTGFSRLKAANRLMLIGNTPMYRRFYDDYPFLPQTNYWSDVFMTGFSEAKTYVVQTGVKVIQRCILMTTDPGDLVLDPTCGSGTTAYVAEQWGRRWITIDTSRVALALARARIMGARYPYYLLSDSAEGQMKEAQLRGVNGTWGPANTTTRGDIRQGFVYERVPHITLKSIANNAEIDVIWEEYQTRLEPLRERLNALLGKRWQEWEVPRELGEDETQIPYGDDNKKGRDEKQVPFGNDIKKGKGKTQSPYGDDNQKGNDKQTGEVETVHAEWWAQRMARQKAIDASIAAKAEFENLYDRPYEDKNKVRVAGPFTVESLSPHRMLAVQDDDLAPSATSVYDDPKDAGNYVQVILDTLKASGVQQADKNARITFESLQPWPGDGVICAEGRYLDADGQLKRAGIMIGPEFGTVGRQDLVVAARAAADANFDVLIACAFNFEAQTTDFNALGRIRVLKARMNADLHMAEDLKNTGKGNLFVVFGEPDIEIQPAPHDEIRVQVKGIDVFHPGTGEVTSSAPDELACWFIDTDYNDESFFVRQAYFLGANDPYKSLKTTLKAEIDREAWESLCSDTSRAFPKPESGRIAVKVINHLGDEVMKVFTVR